MLKKSTRSFIFSFFRIIETLIIFCIVFIFDRYCYSLAAMKLFNYECDAMEQSDTLGKMQMSLTNGVLITLSMILKLDLAVTPLLQREINRLLAMDK